MNDDLTPPRVVAVSDWKVLDRIFSGEESGFRHHMGLARDDTHEFFSPTPDGAALLAERSHILSAPDGNSYLIASPDGIEAVEEFAGMIKVGTGGGGTVPRESEHRRLGLALEPDWLLLAPPGWRVAAACVCFPTRWSLEGKASAKLADIHGVVPQLNDELERKIETFFGRVRPGEGWGRANWGLSSNARLNQHPSLPYEPLTENHPLERIQIRVERQHLCKLPRTGAMSFGIRVLNFSLAAAREQHAAILAGLRNQLRTMPAEIARYKGIPTSLWRRL